MDDVIKRFREKFTVVAHSDNHHAIVIDRESMEEFIQSEIRKAKEEMKDKLSSYLQHDILCIRSRCSEGRPTVTGGYEQKFNGKWYEASPVDKTPKCDCGLDDSLK